MKITTLKGSTLLIALSIGLLLSAAVFSLSAVISMRIKTASSSTEGYQAYAAAYSGIEDGLLRYKYALSKGKMEGIFDNASDIKISAEPLISYSLRIANDSLGKNMDSSYYSSWPNTDLKQASTLGSDQSINLNLSKAGQTSKKISQIKIYFSNPYYLQNGESIKVPDAFTSLKYTLSDQGLSQTANARVISSATNTNAGQYSLNVEKLSLCNLSSNCYLKIQPQVASASEAIKSSGKKIIETVNDKTQKFIYYVLEAHYQDGSIVSSDNQAGTARIISVGKVGKTQRTLEATIDGTSGTYLGLTDFGQYK